MKIDPELEKLIPPLSDEEFQQLEKNCCEYGIRDALVVGVFPGSDGEVLVDGHNRYKICTKHGIPFKTVKADIYSREEAIAWMASNQLARRNLHPLDQERLRTARREALAKEAKKRQGMRTDLNIWEKLPRSERPRDIIGKEIGVSGRQVDKLHTINQKATEEVKQAVRSGEMSVNKAYNSLRPKQQDPVKQAKQEHEEFQTKKSDGIVNFKDVQIDKINQDIIGNSLLQEVLKLINEVDKFAMIHKTEELKTLTTAVKDDERGIIADKCKTGRMTLQIIENYIRGI